MPRLQVRSQVIPAPFIHAGCGDEERDAVNAWWPETAGKLRALPTALSCGIKGRAVGRARLASGVCPEERHGKCAAIGIEPVSQEGRALRVGRCVLNGGSVNFTGRHYTSFPSVLGSLSRVLFGQLIHSVRFAAFVGSLCLVAIPSDGSAQSGALRGYIEYADGKVLQFSDFVGHFERGESPRRNFRVSYENTLREVPPGAVKEVRVVDFTCETDPLAYSKGSASVITKTGIEAPSILPFNGVRIRIRDDLTGEVRLQDIESFVCARRLGGPKLNVRRVVFLE
jgi:hypothetical protein